ncbi:MAG: O-antigen ligase family protein, partial [Caldisericaceae bacterium]|nr:O-antigen ligase family protein [Caldisericaceae bacterium]
FIFFNPFSHTTAIKEICFYGSVTIVLTLIYFKKIDFSFRSPLTLPFALFTAWAFIGLFFAVHKENSIHDFYAHLLKYLAIYYILLNFFNSRKRLNLLSWVIIISTTVFSIGGMIYFYLILGNNFPKARIVFQETPSGIIGFVTIFAIMLSLHFISKRVNFYQKLVLMLSLAATVLITFFTLSRGSLLALVLSLLLLFVKNKKVVIIFSVFMVIALSVVPLKNSLTFDAMQKKILNSARINKIWPTHFEIIKGFPIFGIGFGMDEMSCNQELWDKYSAKVSPERRVVAIDPHNIVVSTALRVGLVGLALFLYIIFAFARMCWITIRHGSDNFIKSWGLCMTAAFVAWFAKGMFEPALSHVPAIVLYTIFAMMTILWKLDSESNFPTLQNQ